MTLQSSLGAPLDPPELSKPGLGARRRRIVPSSSISSSSSSLSGIGCLINERAYSRSRYMHSIAVVTPSSYKSSEHIESGRWAIFTFRMCSPISFARSICFWSEVAVRRASVNDSTVSFLTAVPTPRASTRSAQKNWSPKNGRIMVGMPAAKNENYVNSTR